LGHSTITEGERERERERESTCTVEILSEKAGPLLSVGLPDENTDISYDLIFRT
jgi:hypothetical protein